MRAIQEGSMFRNLVARLEARRRWEAANPVLAAAWSEALREDDHRTYLRDLESARREAAADAPHQLRKLGVPERAIRAMVSADKSVPAMRGAAQWLQEGRHAFLWLMGGPGTGKTVAAAYCAAQALIQAAGKQTPSGGVPPVVVRWVHAVELGTLSSFNESDRAFFEDCLRARLLVLDDFASENLHPEAMARLERLVNHRYGANLRTVFTTNLGDAGMADKRFARIVDRLRECALEWECGNESMRRPHQ